MNRLNDKDGFATPKGSINRHIINGVRANEYFSPRLISLELIANNQLSFLEHENILEQADLMLSSSKDQSPIIIEILYKYGKRLAEILYVFENPTLEQISNRKDYTIEDWDYLKSIKKIYVAGGLLTQEFTKVFKQAINDFYSDKKYGKEIVFLENSSNLALEGLAKRIKRDALIFDFGQTKVKYGVFQNKVLTIEKSIMVDFNKGEDLINYARNCNEFVLQVITEKLIDNPNIDEVHIAISNYVNHGKISPSSWFYGTLHLIEPEYENYLITNLTDILKRKIYVKLYHDTTSMGYFIEEREDSMLISLGTAFGVSYF